MPSLKLDEVDEIDPDIRESAMGMAMEKRGYRPSVSPKADGLQIVEALLKSAGGSINLTIHPRCRRLITALRCYTRSRRADQWMDYSEDPQHPHEDLVDSLCGGLKLEFPAGRAPATNFRRVPAAWAL